AHPDRRHRVGDDGWPATVVASGRASRRGADTDPGGPEAGAAGAAESRPAVVVKTGTAPPCFSREIRLLLLLSAQLRLEPKLSSGNAGSFGEGMAHHFQRPDGPGHP